MKKITKKTSYPKLGFMMFLLLIIAAFSTYIIYALIDWDIQWFIGLSLQSIFLKVLPPFCGLVFIYLANYFRQK